MNQRLLQKRIKTVIISIEKLLIVCKNKKFFFSTLPYPFENPGIEAKSFWDADNILSVFNIALTQSIFLKVKIAID